MPRISGVTIPDQKRVEVALTYIYGIGRSQSRKILEQTKVDFNKRANALSSEEVARIRDVIEQRHVVEGALRQRIATNIKVLKDIGSWRGGRHTKHLTLRGQRTRTNSRTVRGNVRRTVGSGKRKMEKK